jgi:hypothetical protein
MMQDETQEDTVALLNYCLVITAQVERSGLRGFNGKGVRLPGDSPAGEVKNF